MHTSLANIIYRTLKGKLNGKLKLMLPVGNFEKLCVL